MGNIDVVFFHKAYLRRLASRGGWGDGTEEESAEGIFQGTEQRYTVTGYFKSHTDVEGLPKGKHEHT